MLCRLILLYPLLVCACGADEPAAACPASAAPTMPIAAAQGQLSLGFDVDISAPGVQVAAGIGTFQGLPLLVYEQQPWPEAGYTLYQGLAVGAGEWRLVWFYCAGGKLVALYHESTSGGGPRGMDTSGTCTSSDGARSASVDLPAAKLVLPHLVGGYSISGSDIELGCSSPGRVRVGDRDLQLLAFATVDCRDCGSPGWRELHSILWDPERGRACFAILYLVTPGQVLLQYALSLPDLGDPGPMQFSAAWTAPD